MILPNQSSSIPDESDGIAERTSSFFAPGGSLQKACEHEEFPYEPRPQQRSMAEAVAAAVAAPYHLAVEAGTGVGKSFAYLVPAILTATLRQQQVAISTYTISLQEQLIRKDIPFLRDHLGVPFKAVLVKGRGNYLCLRRLARARRMGGDLFRSDQGKELDRVRYWADKTMDGSLQDIKEQPSNYVWSMVCAEQGNCMWKKCRDYEQCFFMKARQQIHDAHILVVNHHLLFADLALRMHGAGFLPRYATLIIDEAHQVENVASEHFGIRLSQYAFEQVGS